MDLHYFGDDGLMCPTLSIHARTGANMDRTNGKADVWLTPSGLQSVPGPDMNLDEALAVWAYMQHQYKPTAEARAKADEAWRVICREANKVIYSPRNVPGPQEMKESEE